METMSPWSTYINCLMGMTMNYKCTFRILALSVVIYGGVEKRILYVRSDTFEINCILIKFNWVGGFAHITQILLCLGGLRFH